MKIILKLKLVCEAVLDPERWLICAKHINKQNTQKPKLKHNNKCKNSTTNSKIN